MAALLIGLLAVSHHASAARLAETEAGATEYSRLVMLSTNDVYKMVGRSNDLMAWAFDGDLATAEGEKFVDACKANPESCFPGSAAQHLGLREQRMDEIRLRMTAEGEPKPILVDGDLGCSKTLQDLHQDNIKFGNMLDVGFSAQLRKRQRLSEDPQTLFLNILAGDFLSPSYTAVKTKGMHMLSLMNEMEVDMVGFGNHDFDFGNQCGGNMCIIERMQASNFLWLGANSHPANNFTEALGTSFEVPEEIKYKVGKEPRTLQRNPVVFQPDSAEKKTYNRLYWTEVVNERKLCIFGTTQANEAKSSARATFDFSDATEAGLRALRALQDEPAGCDLVVALTHQRTGYDVLFWKAAIDAGLTPPDVMWGGHDHYAAFLHLQHPNDPSRMTYIWKMGADAHFFGEMLVSGEPDAAPQFQLLPVVEGSCGGAEEFCSRVPSWDGCAEWAARYSSTYNHYAKRVQELKQIVLPVQLYGLYDTANVRVKESRGANLLADLSRLGVGADVAYLQGGAIRQDVFDPKSEHGEALTALDLYEEFPFNNAISAIEMSLMQVYGLCAEAVRDRQQGGISVIRAHVSGLSVLYDELGLVQLTFEGSYHAAGLVDRRIAGSGSNFLSGTVLWSRQEGFGEHDPLSKLSIASAAYGFFIAPGGMMRLSGDLAEVESQCAYRRNAKSSFLNRVVTCVDGKPPRSYYDKLAAKNNGWRDCGLQPGFLSDTPCWSVLADLADELSSQEWPNIRRRIVAWRMAGQAGPLKNRMTHIFSHEGEGNFGTLHAKVVIQAAKAVEWKVGGETDEELSALGVKREEMLAVPYENLPVQRFLDTRTQIRQARLHGLSKGAKKFSVADLASGDTDAQEAVQEYKELLVEAVETQEHVPQHVGHEIDKQLDLLTLLEGFAALIESKKLSHVPQSQNESVDLSVGAESLVQLQNRASSLCRMAAWAALEHEVNIEGREFHRAARKLCA
eukprot:TRINITY_DN15396_c0_g1_i1.p1 TRINITY_DN15396_c0_g1~~TRINITY_DN15396_c0_g1_i1.p1  ORF type:complete len:962 (+),score=157.73 TRINITY_DN15396_c0_g1_i1:62-2947(+)